MADDVRLTELKVPVNYYEASWTIALLRQAIASPHPIPVDILDVYTSMLAKMEAVEQLHPFNVKPRPQPGG